MKNIIFPKIVLGLFIFFGACNNAPKNEHNHEGEHQHATTEQTEVKKIEAVQSKTSSEILKNALTNYLALKDFLVASKSPEAQKTAVSLLEALKNAPQDEANIKTIQENLTKISQTDDLEQQRVAFEPVSDNLYALLKGNKVNTSPIYWQYCPMAFQDKGAAWISDKSEIRNPYFGDQMLKCGEVKETLE